MGTIEKLGAEELGQAYEGSYYTIAGAGGDLDEWTEGITRALQDRGIGTPKRFYRTTGRAVNMYAGGPDAIAPRDLFPYDLVFLLFPLDGLEIGELAIFKLNMQDRWFDDIVDNMRGHR